MNENKTTTYGDLKYRKAALRAEQRMSDWLSKPTIDRLNDMEELRQVSQAIKKEELFLLWGITPEESYGELPIEPKVYKRVKYVAIAVSIAVILAIVLFAGSGCNTIDGMRTDIHQWTDTPSHHTEK